MPAAEVRVLGPVEVVGADGPIALAAKQLRVLAALVVADDRALGLDELVEAVWDGAAPASARKLVQVYVSQLRKVLPEGIGIETRQRGYTAVLDGGVLDADRFERLLGESVAAREAGNPALSLSLADRALALWRGRAFGELAYEDFARAESERLEELRLAAVEERLAARLELGSAAEALAEVLAHADENGLRERAHELALLALYRARRQAEALEHFSTYRARLDDELGLEPGSALRELQRRILQQDPELDVAADPQATSALPLPPNPLIGRERDVAELRVLLERRESRLIVLTGAGGSGKTRLALEVARRAAGSYANGAVLVELASLQDPALVLPTVAQALEVVIEPDEDLVTTLGHALESHELLLVLDNAEHVRSAAPAYAEIIARTQRMTLLVTSRAVLHVSGEQVFPVDPLVEDDAVELLRQRARLLDPAFDVSDENEGDIREICRRVDGLPLALELAAARLRTLTPRALRERLDDRLGVLTRGPRDLPSRQQALRETISWSVDLLEPGEQDVLGKLAVFPGGASLEAAEAVCGATVDSLGALVDDHLVQRVDAGGQPRFGLLETIREYAFELLGERRAAVEALMGSYFAELLDAIEDEARISGEVVVARIDPEIDNVRAAIETAAAAGNTELELRLAGSLWRYCWVRGLAGEGLWRIEGALDRNKSDASPALARALKGAAGLAWSLGDLDRAKRLGSAAVAAAAEAGSPMDEMSANTVLGVVANDEDDREAARLYHRRSLELAEQIGVEPVIPKLNLGIVALDEGDYDEARDLLEDVLAIHRRNDTVSGVGFASINLGVVYYALGDHEASLAAFREAHGRFEEIGFRAHVAHAVQGLAAYEASKGRYDEAARLLGHARAVLDEVGSSETDFAVDMVARVKGQSRAALGHEAFDAAYAEGRESSAWGTSSKKSAPSLTGGAP